VVACHGIAILAQQQRYNSLPPAERAPPFRVPLLSRWRCARWEQWSGAAWCHAAAGVRVNTALRFVV